MFLGSLANARRDRRKGRAVRPDGESKDPESGIHGKWPRVSWWGRAGGFSRLGLPKPDFRLGKHLGMGRGEGVGFGGCRELGSWAGW